MSLGLALVIIFILYLIHANKAWKGAAITFGILLLSGGITVAAIAAYYNHQDAVQWNVVSVTPDPNSSTPIDPSIPSYAVPRHNESGPVDCYDPQGNLLPNEAKSLGGTIWACGNSETAEPTTYRNQIPEAKKARAEKIEACWQSVTDRHGNKADYDKCVAENPR